MLFYYTVWRTTCNLPRRNARHVFIMKFDISLRLLTAIRTFTFHHQLFRRISLNTAVCSDLLSQHLNDFVFFVIHRPPFCLGVRRPFVRSDCSAAILRQRIVISPSKLWLFRVSANSTDADYLSLIAEPYYWSCRLFHRQTSHSVKFNLYALESHGGWGDVEF